MTMLQHILVIAICAVGTMSMRFLPFLVFSEKRETPRFIRYLGDALPTATFGMLVVYTLRNVDLMTGSRGIPEAIALAVTVALHIRKRKMLLSIVVGTAVYMLLVQLVF